MTESQVLAALWTGAFLLIHLGVIARVILRPHRQPASRVAWIVVMIVLPVIGILTYILLGETSIGCRRVSRLRKQHSVLRSDFNCRNAPPSGRLSCLLPSRHRRDGGPMADDPPALEQHHCDVGANFVRIDRLKQTCTSNFKPSSRCCR